MAAKHNPVALRFCIDYEISGTQYRRLVTLVNKAVAAQENEHNDGDLPATASAAASEAITAVNKYAKKLKFDGVDWNGGLYPTFKKGEHNRLLA